MSVVYGDNNIDESCTDSSNPDIIEKVVSNGEHYQTDIAPNIKVDTIPLIDSDRIRKWVQDSVKHRNKIRRHKLLKNAQVRLMFEYCIYELQLSITVNEIDGLITVNSYKKVFMDITLLPKKKIRHETSSKLGKNKNIVFHECIKLPGIKQYEMFDLALRFRLFGKNKFAPREYLSECIVHLADVILMGGKLDTCRKLTENI